NAAQRMWQELLATRKKVLSDAHPAVLATQAKLGSTYRLVGDLRSSRKLLQHVLAVLDQALGSEHPSTLGVASDLAATLAATGRARQGAEAIRLGRYVFSTRQRQLGSAHPLTVNAMRSLSQLASGYDDELALSIGDEAARRSSATLGRNHVDT